MNEALADSALAAFMFDHRGKTQLLKASETESASNYINKVNPQTVPHVMNFISRKPPFSKKLFEREYLKSALTAWYKSGFQLGFDEGLVELALALVGAWQFRRVGMPNFNDDIHIWVATLAVRVEKADKLRSFLYR